MLLTSTLIARATAGLTVSECKISESVADKAGADLLLRLLPGCQIQRRLMQHARLCTAAMNQTSIRGAGRVHAVHTSSQQA